MGGGAFHQIRTYRKGRGCGEKTDSVWKSLVVCACATPGTCSALAEYSSLYRGGEKGAELR